MTATQAVRKKPTMNQGETGQDQHPGAVHANAGQPRMSERQVDQLLVERVQKGDKRAFDLLIQKYQHRIVSLVSRYVSDHAEAQDVAQSHLIVIVTQLEDIFAGSGCIEDRAWVASTGFQALHVNDGLVRIKPID